MNYKVIAYVLFVDFLAIMSPGPDFFMVLKSSVSHAFKSGFYVALGISVGSFISFLACLLGVGVIIVKTPILFTLVKIVGAIYLCYLALSAIFSKVKIQEPQLVYKDNSTSLGGREGFKIGLFCNLTNPKSLMFMTALSAYVANNGTPKLDGPPIAIISSLVTIIWFSLVAFLFGNFHVRKFFYQRQKVINILFGLILLYVVTKIVFI